jgi:tRNA G10  N-methylase Trm11
MNEGPFAPHDWTFDGAATRELTHGYHDYPARMIPQVAGQLLDLFGRDARLLFDPYCGTGTSLVEAMLRGLNAVGTDLNPLARLIARAKTSTPDLAAVDATIRQFAQFTRDSAPIASPVTIHGISNLDFWFKSAVIEKLAQLRRFIDEIPDASVQLFFQVAFSETVRESSNTRSTEFKLYRYEAARLEKHNPDVEAIMSAKLDRNRSGLEKFIERLGRFEPIPAARVCDFNTVVHIPPEEVAPSSVDLVVTSPPYGDSHTTVAYGQYSRLSAAWLGLSDPGQVDRTLMGGKTASEIPEFPCAELNQALGHICAQDEKRAREVAAFYSDLGASIAHVARVIKPGGHACYVVGNRKVKGVVLPTDLAIRGFFESHGFGYVDTFYRTIPNKRMPLRNSPTNAPGLVDSTMVREYIVVMRKGQT